ncbi:hypothetical protein L249_1698 [Ophiocordyceps polyrhachis-furcata BCC 54312]|uniref:Integrase catalytic domain-containing protein n=1 Tax=Ophiocordyceps polyrhachis-furcata BCC 54312 TaxID=1330021 RepID=A0A367LSE4_9HYPO|nr:hypothetical protein L249_1698 [Ophiocordyceps polyrhachis-furcata BCC 54312]
MLTRDNLTGWLKVAPVKELIIVAITKFVLSIIYRFSIPIQAVINSRPEVKSSFRTILKDFGVYIILISRYNLKANAIVENEVKELLNLLAARIRVLGRKKEDINKARLKVAAYRSYLTTFGEQPTIGGSRN